MEQVKMFLFARWISTCYADTCLDGMSVLNRKKGNWWKKQLHHFNKVVYPEYVKNGTVKSTKEFL